MTAIEQELSDLRDLVARLRDVFTFPEDKCYDKGYPMENNDGWSEASIVASPADCLEEMIRVCSRFREQQK